LLSVAILPSTINARAGMSADTAKTADPLPRTAPAKLSAQAEPSYSVEAGLNGDIFPAFASYVSFRRPAERPWGMVTVSVANGTDSTIAERVTVSVPGWSDQEIQMIDLAAGQSRTLLFAPTFLPRFFQNKEIVAASALVNVTDMAGHVVYRATLPVRLRSSDDMYWGRGFKYAQFIASWVTPHDARVEALLGRAKEFMPARRLPGYEDWKSPAEQSISTTAQARAIYRALQQQGVSYVKSSMTFGSPEHAEVSERVRMPGESLERASANCIDGAVLYASLFENLGMESVVVLVPGHSYVGVRLSQSGNNYLYIETSLTGRASFEASVESARRGLAKFQPKDVLRIDIDDARADGIYPIPGGSSGETHDVVGDAPSDVGHSSSSASHQRIQP
jgi:hypothetical protein